MKSAKKHFEQNIERVKNLGSIYKTINLQTTPVVDLSDILRAQYVLLVSALDHFIHEIVRLGMIEIYNEKRKVTKEFKAFILSIDEKVLFKKAIMEEKNDKWLDYQIRYRNGFKSFQQADKLKEAMLLIIDTDIWEELANILNEDIKSLKNRLNLIIDRRNQIAHEADIEPTYQELRDIHIDDINDSIEFIENLVTRIFEVCNSDI
jgi:hypothetical protein